MSKFLSSLLNKAMFKTPPRSAFPQSNEVKISSRIGKLVPVQRWLLNPGDTIDVNLQQLTRFMPLAAPIMHNFKVDFFALEIPDRLSIPVGSAAGSIDGGFENFHNLDVSDVDRPTMPQTTLPKYVKWLSDYRVNPNGTLLEALGYPCFKDLYRSLDDSILDVNHSYAYSTGDSLDDVFGSWYITNGLTYQGVGFSIGDNGVDVLSFANWLYERAGSVLTLAGLCQQCGIGLTNGVVLAESDFIPYLLSINNLTSERAVKLWSDYVFSETLGSWIATAIVDSAILNTTPISLKPLWDFWVAYYDWFINTNILKPASKRQFLADRGLVYTSNASYGYLPGASATVAHYLVDYPNILWMDDYFTSAFDVEANGGSVSTASLTTIQQFREASAVDKLRILLQYTGKRYIDQVLGIFGVHSSNELLDRCKVVGVSHFNMQVSDVDQNSKSDIDSSLGQLAGKSLSVGENGSFIHHTAEEHSTVMVFMAVRPSADYDQVLPADLLKVSAYDYLIPQLAKVGEQQIRNMELYPNITAAGANVFGYTRRFAEYMYTPNRIIGEFSTSLDYWHAAREFDSQPALNQQFIECNADLDNLDRIFAVRGGDNVLSYLYFDTVISRPLPKYVSYGF